MSGALMRLLGVLELFSVWNFDAEHVRGIFNVAADVSPRWDRTSVLRNLRSVRPDVPWKVRDLRDVGTSLCTSVVATDSCEAPLRPRLNAFIRAFWRMGRFRVRFVYPFFCAIAVTARPMCGSCSSTSRTSLLLRNCG